MTRLVDASRCCLQDMSVGDETQQSCSRYFTPLCTKTMLGLPGRRGIYAG
jgi:hypothetical protein